MPSRDILQNQILPRLSCDIEVKLAEKLSCIKGLTVSVDGWTDISRCICMLLWFQREKIYNITLVKFSLLFNL
jgi:hypothetical protein